MRFACGPIALTLALVGCDGEGTDSSPPDTSPIETGDTGEECDPTLPAVKGPDFSLPPDWTTSEWSPATLDAAADLEPEKLHLVAEPAAQTIEPLFVFLPEAGHAPSEYQAIVGAAARSGFRAVALAYPTDDSKVALCAGQGDACLETFNDEKAYGVDGSVLIDVDEANSVEGRLRTLLVALDAAAPGTGWDAFLADGEVSWGDIVLAGHGEGATLAGWIGRDWALRGSAFWGSGCDDTAGTPAAWCYDARVTPPDLMYAIAHENEGYEAAIATWAALGMDDFGVVADADVSAPRYCTGTHSLATNLPAEDVSTDYFQSLAIDGKFAADDAGVPLLVDDWWYLMTTGARL